MNSHFQYEKMPDNTQNWILPVNMTKKNCKNWIVTEKVHGANFCFVTDGTTVKPAKRNDFLETDENKIVDTFFGYKKVFDKYVPNILSLFKDILDSNRFYDLDTVNVYGELFGGKYPDVETPQGIEPVQSEILYCPDLEFYAFDIAIVTLDAIKIYLDYDLCITLFEKANLFYAQPLLIGSFTEALNYSVDFQSTIPKLLKLVPPKDNPAEGIVVKPIKTIVIQGKKNKERVIFKRKAEKFNERIASNKFYTNDNDLIKFLETFVTKNRYNNLISKNGKNMKDDEIFTKYIEDVLLDAYLDKIFLSKWNSITEFEQKNICSKLKLSILNFKK